MSGYFKPLRRKIGVLTLVLACVFAIGWIDSLTQFRSLYFVDWKRSVIWQALSRDAKLAVEGKRFDHTNSPTFLYNNGPVETHVDLGGVPYSSIVIPLTLLSAYLLLSKPRSKRLPT